MNNKSPKKGYGYIYKYTSPSGKSYIGQTVNSLATRAGHDGKNYQGCPFFHQAIKKYGFENFEVTILAEVKEDQLDKAEKKYITLFNTLAPNGYNYLEGGKVGRLKPYRIVYQYDLNTGKLIQEFLGLKAPSEQYGLNPQSLCACLNGATYTCGGYGWSYQKLDKYPIHERIVNNEQKQIYMYSLQGELLNTFPSVSQAASYVKGDRSAIKKACRHELKTAYGYKWECTEILNEKKYNNTPKKVYKIDKESNKIIEVFPSISAAAKSLKKETSLLRRVIDKDNRTAYGFKWKTAQGSTTMDS